MTLLCLFLGWGGSFYEASVAALMACKADDKSCIDSSIKTWSVSVTLQADIAPTYVVFDNATLVTMDDQLGQIENGRIVVRNGRIQDVGPATSVPIPADAQVFNVEGGCIPYADHGQTQSLFAPFNP